MNLSKEQLDILQAVQAPDCPQALIIEAKAGTGKTFTLLQTLPSLQGKVFFGAYNKTITVEIQSKVKGVSLPEGTTVEVSTMHAIGLRALTQGMSRRPQVDSWKVQNLFALAYPEPIVKAYNGFVRKAVSLAKQQGFRVLNQGTPGDWGALIDHFDLDLELPEGVGIDQAIEICNKVLTMSNEELQVIDFDDMLYLPLLLNRKLPTFDWALVDEAQDTNATRRALAFGMLAPHSGRLIAVGDPWQAIYGFTGADSDALDLIRAHATESKTLPLSTTYRCPPAVVAEASRYLGGEPYYSAKEAPGTVRRIPELGTSSVPGFWSETLTPQDGILCRNTRPLVELAYQLLRMGTACKVEGREIGQGLVKLCRRWKLSKLVALVDKLSEYKAREYSRWMSRGKEAKAAAIEDQVDSLLAIADKLQTEGKTEIEDLIQFIESLFGDSAQGQKPLLTLCTIHRSKGREWERVYLWGTNIYQPSKYAKLDWQRGQERNLSYVAITRALNELVYVDC